MINSKISALRDIRTKREADADEEFANSPPPLSPLAKALSKAAGAVGVVGGGSPTTRYHLLRDASCSSDDSEVFECDESIPMIKE